MIWRVSLALAALLYFLQALHGVSVERNLYLSILYFIIFYTLMSIYHTIYLYIKLRIIQLEQEEKERQRELEKKEREAKVAQTFANLFKEPSNN